VLRKVYSAATLKTVDLPPGVVVEYRNGLGIAINYNSADCVVPIPSHATILIGEKTLKPAGVVVWKE
jgi:beta-galactosidase